MTKRPLPFPATPRRTALLAAAVALLFAASLRAGEYTSLAGVKAAGFQKWLDDSKAQDYQPFYVNGYDVGDHAEFAGVAIKTTAKTPFEARYDMTSDEYQDWFEEMAKKGFRPRVVSAYHSEKGPRFAATWIKDSYTAEWKVKHDLTQKQYEAALTAMRKDGLSPACVSAYQGVDGAVRFTALFYAFPGWTYESRHDLTADKYQDQLDEWTSNGFRLRQVFVYDTPDGQRFLAIASKNKNDNDPIVWKERHGMTGPNYQKEFDKLGEDGYRPDCICGYREGKEVRFAVIWLKKK